MLLKPQKYAVQGFTQKIKTEKKVKNIGLVAKAKFPQEI